MRAQRSFVEPSRELPVRAEVDALVVGCGTAGFAAAVAAGRSGVRTMAIDCNGYPGGSFTGGLVWKVDGLHGKHPKTGEKTAPVRGIMAELAARADEMGALDKWTIDGESNKLIMINMMEEAGVELLLHCWFADVIMEGRKVRGVIVESKSGREAIFAKTVIDCTGDADVASRAGVECAHSSHWAGPAVDYVTTADPDTAERCGRVNDEIQRFYWEMHRDIQQLPLESSYFPVPSFGFPSKRICRNTLGRGYDLWDVEGLTRAEIDGRKRIFEFLAKYAERFPELSNARPLLFAQMLGIRETRRIKGEYVLTFADVKSLRRFDDVVTISPVFWQLACVFEIPYRCLVPAAVDGLLVSGRCISDTRIVHDGARIISTCVGLGEAAGAAAALAVKDGVEPRAVDTRKLQQRIRAQNGELDLHFERADYSDEQFAQFALHETRLKSYGYEDRW